MRLTPAQHQVVSQLDAPFGLVLDPVENLDNDVIAVDVEGGFLQSTRDSKLPKFRTVASRYFLLDGEGNVLEGVSR